MVNKARTSAFGAGTVSVSKFSDPVDIPKISSITYVGDDTATPPAGGDTITVNGSFFKPGCYVYVDRTQASVVSFISSTQITFTAPAKSAGTYTLYVYNPDGGTAIYIPGINYSGTPTWSTASGSIGTAYETIELSSNVTVLSASSNSTVKYRLYSGSLPVNAVLNINTGAITGVIASVAGVTTYTFVIEAYDLENQGTLRTFSITINPDVVTWSSPADGTTINGQVGTPITQALSSSSAAGRSITYAANTLPSGLSISGSNVTGTPTVAQSITSLITATAATTNRFATRILNWIIVIASEIYFPYVSLLLKTTATNTQTNSTFLDSSPNNFNITRNGTSTQGSFSPYRDVGYWSNYFNGTTDYAYTSTASSNFNYGTGNVTIEFWVYPLTNAAATYNPTFFTNRGNGAWSDDGAGIRVHHQNTIFGGGSFTQINHTTNIPSNRWSHYAFVRTGNTINVYLNGTLNGTASFTGALGSSTAQPALTTSDFVGTGGREWANCYMSNVRIVKGVAVYTGNFTPPISPLATTQSAGTNIAAITGTETSLLICQSNRFRDNSTNNFAITVAGTPRVQAFQPFNLPASYTTAAYGGSGYFNGTTDYLSAPSTTAFAFGASVNFTVECWVYLTAYSSGGVSGGALVGTTFSNFDGWFINSGQDINTLRLTSNATGTWADNITVSAGNGLPLNQWTHIALVRNGAVLTLYKNGVSVGSLSSTSSYNFTSPGNTAYIGYAQSRYVPGYISDVRIVKGTAVYTGAFTPPTTPITAITNTSLLLSFTNAGIYDAAVQNNAVTVGSAQASTTVAKWPPTSMKFNGSTDYLTIVSNPALNLSTGSFTVEAWVYLLGMSGDYFVISATGNGGAFFGFTGSTQIGYGRAAVAWDYNIASGVSTGAWYHLAWSRSGTSMRIFVNGNQVGTTQTTSQAYDLTTTSTAVGSQGAIFYLNGYIEDLRITKGVGRYTANFSVPTAAFPTK